MIDPILTREIVRAVFHDTRLAILVLCGGSRTLAQIREELDLTHGAARYHVDVLVRAELLYGGPRGYRSGPGWSDFVLLLEDMQERHANLRGRLLETVGPTECSRRARRPSRPRPLKAQRRA